MNTLKFKKQNELLNEALRKYAEMDKYNMMHFKNNCEIIGHFLFIRHGNQTFAVYDARRHEFIDFDVETYHKESIVEDIEQKADLRALEAAKYPDDKRYQNSSIALYQLRNYVVKLPKKHDFFVLNFLLPIGYDSYEIGSVLDRYGFDELDLNPKLMVKQHIKMMRELIQIDNECEEYCLIKYSIKSKIDE